MLAKWNPFNGEMNRSALPAFDDLFREADGLLRSALRSDLGVPGWSIGSSPQPATDIQEFEDEIQLKMDLPGHDVKSLQIKLEGDTLTVQSERKQAAKSEGGEYLRSERVHGIFARSFVVPDTVDASRCEAHFDDGVLTIRLPKREDAKPRTIEIKVKS